MRLHVKIKTIDGSMEQREYDVHSYETATEEILPQLKEGEEIVSILTQLLQGGN